MSWGGAGRGRLFNDEASLCSAGWPWTQVSPASASHSHVPSFLTSWWAPWNKVKKTKRKTIKETAPKSQSLAHTREAPPPTFFFNKAKNPRGVVRKRVLCPYLSSWYHCKHLVELDDETLIKPSKGLLLGAAPSTLTTGGLGQTTQENLGGHTSARDNPRPRMVTKTERGCDCVREHKEDLAHWKLHMLARPAADLHMVLYHSSPYIKMLWWQQMALCHVLQPSSIL